MAGDIRFSPSNISVYTVDRGRDGRSGNAGSSFNLTDQTRLKIAKTSSLVLQCDLCRHVLFGSKVAFDEIRIELRPDRFSSLRKDRGGQRDLHDDKSRPRDAKA